ncbi:MAG: hypothetical protein ACK4M9_17405 [Anaerobacillus sp.]|uniref:hypothetical protein n=1 Tax=Anaerobacillus sp. TaxID=1872506 RepID=UPI00391A7327
MKTFHLGKKSRKKQPTNFYQYKIESEIAALQRSYGQLNRKMEEMHLENIQSDELLLKYLRRGG